MLCGRALRWPQWWISVLIKVWEWNVGVIRERWFQWRGWCYYNVSTHQLFCSVACFFFLFFLVLRLFTGIGCGTERSTCGERESAVQCVCVFKRDRERERENVCMWLRPKLGISQSDSWKVQRGGGNEVTSRVTGKRTDTKNSEKFV